MQRRFPIGAELTRGEPGVHVRVWAPTHDTVTLVVEAPAQREVVLAREPGGYHATFVPGLGAGARYRFRLGADPALLADPASRFQPAGPFGPSEVIDPGAFAWTDHAWRGLPSERHVIYELHVGTFTPDGSWAAAAEELSFLAELGVTTIELMPVNEVAGRHNWGYDGVNLWAPTHNYGRPDDMRRFVNRAHALGLAVILDVVYNHLGPAGSSMFVWAPAFRSEQPTDWGDGLRFEGEDAAGVRAYFTANAAYWISELHLDGLRIDATQEIHDRSPRHVLGEVIRAAREAAGVRRLFVVGENEPQDTGLFEHGFDAMWNDDFHHTAHVAATGVIEGYLHDYGGTAQELVSTLTRGFLYQGQVSSWQRNPRGTSTRGRSLGRFVHYLENHDQVANLGFGERLIDRTDPATLRALTAVLLLGPAVPMLFQGQETGTRTPWMFFADHSEDLHAPIREGRSAFVSQFARLATPEARARLPDPCAEDTFRRCVLDPRERTLDSPVVRLHQDLLRLRRDDPAFSGAGSITGAVLSERAFCVRFFRDDDSGAGDRLLLVNLGPTFARAVVPEPLVAPPAGHGWSVLWSSEHPRYGGHGTPEPVSQERLAIPARSAVVLAPDPARSLRTRSEVEV